MVWYNRRPSRSGRKCANLRIIKQDSCLRDEIHVLDESSPRIPLLKVMSYRKTVLNDDLTIVLNDDLTIVLKDEMTSLRESTRTIMPPRELYSNNARFSTNMVRVSPRG